MSVRDRPGKDASSSVSSRFHGSLEGGKRGVREPRWWGAEGVGGVAGSRGGWSAVGESTTEQSVEACSGREKSVDQPIR